MGLKGLLWDTVPEADAADAARGSLCFRREPGPTCPARRSLPGPELSAPTLRFFTYQPWGWQDPRPQRGGQRKRRGTAA